MASSSGSKTPPISSNSKSSATKKKRNKDKEGVSSDEERWLDALESGKLEEMDDELKKIKPKDPKLMTARQRAMYERGSETTPAQNETLLALPSGYKEKVMTAEAIQKAALKSQKRKQQADEKREKDKKKTMERILKKQETKTPKSANIKTNKDIPPLVSYKQTVEGTGLFFHNDIGFPLEAATAEDPPKPVLCAMGCGNLKKYSCAQTGVPLCSLQCYRKNISSRIL